MRDQGSEPWRARTSKRAVHDIQWCYTGICTIRYAHDISRTRGHGKVGLVVMAQPIPEVECISTTCTFIAVLMIVTTPMCVHAVTPLPIKQAISLVPEVVGRSVLARWIGLCLEGFGCQENVSVRTFGWEKLGAQQGCCGRTCHFCTCALE